MNYSDYLSSEKLASIKERCQYTNEFSCGVKWGIVSLIVPFFGIWFLSILPEYYETESLDEFVGVYCGFFLVWLIALSIGVFLCLHYSR